VPPVTIATLLLRDITFTPEASQRDINTQSIFKQEAQVKNKMFVHTSIRTSDIDRSIDFYTRIMGLKLLSRRAIPQNEAEIAFLQDPEEKGARLELTFYLKQGRFIQADYEDRVFDHIAFEVKDIKRLFPRCRRRRSKSQMSPSNSVQLDH
jgi:lactoylglutathione lyase